MSRYPDSRKKPKPTHQQKTHQLSLQSMLFYKCLRRNKAADLPASPAKS